MEGAKFVRNKNKKQKQEEAAHKTIIEMTSSPGYLLAFKHFSRLTLNPSVAVCFARSLRCRMTSFIQPCVFQPNATALTKVFSWKARVFSWKNDDVIAFIGHAWNLINNSRDVCFLNKGILFYYPHFRCDYCDFVSG